MATKTKSAAAKVTAVVNEFDSIEFAQAPVETPAPVETKTYLPLVGGGLTYKSEPKLLQGATGTYIAIDFAISVYDIATGTSSQLKCSATGAAAARIQAATIGHGLLLRGNIKMVSYAKRDESGQKTNEMVNRPVMQAKFVN
jgi:hypothetical protein